MKKACSVGPGSKGRTTGPSEGLCLGAWTLGRLEGDLHAEVLNGTTLAMEGCAVASTSEAPPVLRCWGRLTPATGTLREHVPRSLRHGLRKRMEL